MPRAAHTLLLAALASAASLTGCTLTGFAGQTATQNAIRARGGGPPSESSSRESSSSDAMDRYGGPDGFRARGGIPPYGRWGWMYLPAMEYYGGRGDTRWRWNDGARPGWGGGHHWYGGPPYDRPGW